MKKILITSLSYISKDSRVLKQVKTLLNNNYFVITASFGNLNLNSSNHIHISITSKHKLKFLFLSLNRFYKLTEDLISILNLNTIKEIINPYILDIKNKLKSIDFDLIISNDLLTLPAIFYLSNNKKPIILDLHEYFPEEYTDNKTWLKLYKNFYLHLLKKYQNKLNQINLITVNESIAKLYQENFNLNKFEIIRNIPYFHDLFPRETENNLIKLVHVGGALKSRKVENMIIAFKHVKSNFNFLLDFYLVANDKDSKDYLEYLKKLSQNEIKNHNVKINFLEPIKQIDLVNKLNEYDIGLSYMYPSNINNLYCLPNKLFEYIQARLAILASPNPEMAKLIKEYNLGLVSENYEPEELAKSLENFNNQNILLFKENSNKVSKLLNFEKESQIFLNLVNSLIK